MLRWAIIFLLIALVAALFGFTELYAPAVTIARILVVVFVILFLISLVFGGFRRPPA